MADAITRKHPGTWRSYPLTEASTAVHHLRSDPEFYTATYATSLSRQSLADHDDTATSHLKFTVKYRFDAAASWQWSHGPPSFGIPEGELVLQSSLSDATAFESLIELAKGWEAQPLSTSTNNAGLFSLNTSSLLVSDNVNRKVLGSIHDVVRYVAFSQIEPPWIGPRHGKDSLYLTEPTLLCSLLRKDGFVVTIAAPSLEDVYAVLETDDAERLVVAARVDKQTGKPLCVVLSTAADIETSIEAIMVYLREQTGHSHLVQGMLKHPTNSSASHLDGLLDGLGYCTWNALGLDLDSEKLLGCLRVLRDNNIKVSTFLIDDGWQDVGETGYDYSNHQRRGLAHYKAQKSKIPQGLSELVKTIKSENPEIGEVGVWHALMGYWGAFAKQGYINDTYETRVLDGKMYFADPADVKVITANNIDKFYDDFYTYLAESGITFVKTDVQYMVADISSSSERADVIPAYQAAWHTAVQSRLGGKAISCMSMVPEMIWRSLLQAKSAPIIFRNSDDYFPEIPSSHTWHIWVNAHNALFTQHLNVVLDWDMFQTSHKYAALHAACRCLSGGGPTLLTDIPGDHDVGLINQMVGEAPDGRSITLRPAQVAKASHTFDAITSRTLKIVNETAVGSKLLGVFNVGETDLSVFVSVAEFAAVGQSPWKEGIKAIVFSHQSQTILGPIDIASTLPLQASPGTLIEVNLEPRTCDILSAVEVAWLPWPRAEVLVGVLGLMGKITGAAAVISSNISLGENGQTSISIELKALGDLGVWIHGAELLDNAVKATVGGQGVLDHEMHLRSATSDKGPAQLLTLNTIKPWSRAASKPERAHLIPILIVISP